MEGASRKGCFNLIGDCGEELWQCNPSTFRNQIVKNIAECKKMYKSPDASPRALSFSRHRGGL